VDRNAERERLRRTFDAVARDYQDARPEYPPELYRALLSLTGVRPGTDALCEVGCASGKATLPLARQGFAITAVELGAALAAQARRNLAPFDRVTVINADFETWQPATLPSAGSGPARAGREVPGYGLVFAATAWHWIDPAVKYRKAASLVRPGGHLAFWEAAHVVPDDGDPFFVEIQDVYDSIGCGAADGGVFAKPDTLASAEGEITASGLFPDILVRRFDWEISYTADSYIRLLETFSSNLVIATWQRERLYGEIRDRLALRPDGLVRRHWGAVLHVARTVA
jgi:SAM-dependent methyltransferase